MSGAARSGSAGGNDLVLAWLIPALGAVALVAAGATWLAAAADAYLAGTAMPAQPVAFAKALVQSQTAMPTQRGWIVAGALIGVPLAAVAVPVLTWRSRRAARRARADGPSRHLATVKERRGLGRAARLAETRRLAPGLIPTNAKGKPVTGRALSQVPTGLLIGRTVRGGAPILQGWEDVSVDVWGPRRGKTSTRAVGAVLDAPGPVIATENKRGLYDATAGVRAGLGTVWCFDPLRIATDGQATFTWDPLTRVTNRASARHLAEIFQADVSDDGDGRKDEFFGPAGLTLLANLFLAAAVGRRPIGDVWGWLQAARDTTPVRLLREAGRDRDADGLEAAQTLPEETRGGVFAQAILAAEPLSDDDVLTWITPRPGRPVFDPAAFAESSDTLYALSREGAGSVGAIVTALTDAVCAEAEALAVEQDNGRLAVPMVVVLDEAANVCRWPDLPALYSHYGSRGIVLMTFLQSPAQAKRVWGEKGWDVLWSAATVRVFGGGVADEPWLRGLSELIGDHKEPQRSVSTHKGGRTVTQQAPRSERTFPASELAALDRGRAIVLHGGRPVLVEPQPWMTSPRAAEIKAAAAQWKAREL